MQLPTQPLSSDREIEAKCGTFSLCLFSAKQKISHESMFTPRLIIILISDADGRYSKLFQFFLVKL